MQWVHRAFEAIGRLTVATAALVLGQTILEEEAQGEVPMSAPTRLRPSSWLQAAAIGVAAAALLAAWAIFVRLDIDAEKVEPEAMADAKRQDTRVG